MIDTNFQKTLCALFHGLLFYQFSHARILIVQVFVFQSIGSNWLVFGLETISHCLLGIGDGWI